ncbi:autotransporter-associated beta strand repeat-containing protein [Paludibacterium denitrificans]|uniref:autotransporter-associated beta strand repeat-containing protein n=1 Tax=Paludibacterium denitrificans TaxID=2675226 RepID=UPI001E33295A|nr:autotransporter-associated beta strand repeat-containing protein [Paludibacterium denitrificans]
MLKTVSGTGGLTLTGGTETLSGTNTYTGATNVNTGATLNLTGNGSLANSAVVDNGTLTVQSNSSVAGLTGSGSLVLDGHSLALNNAAGTFAGTISGDGGLVVNAGTAVLTGANTYTGGTTINGGTLEVARIRTWGDWQWRYAEWRDFAYYR